MSHCEKAEEVFTFWMKKARSQNVYISSLILKEKALQIASELKEIEFKACDGWTQRFK